MNEQRQIQYPRQALESPLCPFVNEIFNAGIRAGRALEADRRWFADHEKQTYEVAMAHLQKDVAFDGLYRRICEMVEGK